MDQPKDQNQTQNWAAETRRRLAKRRGKKPQTKAGQIWALWPDIKIALADGERIATIRQWLEEEAGISVTTVSLTTYLRRCRRKESRVGKASTNPSPLAPAENIPDHALSANDPMAGAREALNKPKFDIRTLHGDGDPTDRNLI